MYFYSAEFNLGEAQISKIENIQPFIFILISSIRFPSRIVSIAALRPRRIASSLFPSRIASSRFPSLIESIGTLFPNLIASANLLTRSNSSVGSRFPNLLESHPIFGFPDEKENMSSRRRLPALRMRRTNGLKLRTGRKHLDKELSLPTLDEIVTERRLSLPAVAA